MVNERRAVLLLCAFAALRVFMYAAAFPPFNPIDEIAHVDTVLRYAHGDPPRGVDPVLRDTAELFVLYGMGVSVEPGGVQVYKEPEYREPARRDGPPAPLWRVPPGARDTLMADVFARWHGGNHEAVEPPMYYALAGLWDQIGRRVLGLRGGPRFYWLRFLNALFAAALVWIGWRATSLAAFPTDVRWGVPLVLATIPQDSLYAVTNDALSPVLFGAAFTRLVSMVPGPVAWTRAALAGGLVAATVLTKYTNAPIAVPLVMAGGASLARWRRHGRGAELASLAALVSAASVPLAAWWVRTWIVAGDPLASGVKSASLGWAVTPAALITEHPLFRSSAVISPFWHDLMRTFWRGEFPWRGVPIGWLPLDVWFSVSSALLVALAAGHAWRTRRRGDGQVLTIAGLTFTVAVGLMLWLSIAFRFSVWSLRPSVEYPYFSSGRLIAGTLVPFALLYVEGVRCLVRRPVPVIAGLMIVITTVELVLSLDVFSSSWNWFSALGDARFSSGP